LAFNAERHLLADNEITRSCLALPHLTPRALPDLIRYPKSVAHSVTGLSVTALKAVLCFLGSSCKIVYTM